MRLGKHSAGNVQTTPQRRLISQKGTRKGPLGSLAASIVVIAILGVSAILPIAVSDDSEAVLGVWDGFGGNDSTADAPFSGLDIGDPTGIPPLDDKPIYLLIGSQVSIEGCDIGGRNPIRSTFTYVTPDMGLTLDTSGNTSVSGTVSKVGTITLTQTYNTNSGYREYEVTIQVVGEGATINFEERGGSNVDNLSTRVGGTITLPSTHLDGYIFNGWWTEPIGGTCQGKAGDTYAVTGSVTLYAQWVPEFGMESPEFMLIGEA